MGVHRNPKPGSSYETGSDGAASRPPRALFLKNWLFKPFGASGVVRIGPDMPQDSFGLCFGPNRRFSTHFGSNLMFWPGPELWWQVWLAWLWTSPIAAGKPCLRLRHLSCLNSRHLSCLSSTHLSCLNSRHLSCLNRRHLSSWTTPEEMSSVETGQMSAVEIG